MTQKTASRRLTFLRGFALFGLGVVLGRTGVLDRLLAQVPMAPATTPSDYSQRVVAYIHGNTPITREELGEYLIQRYGPDRLEMLVNQRIIEHAAKERNIDVTPQEIEAELNDNLAGLRIQKTDFIKQVLRQYGKSLYEWENDVIKPRLMLAKLYRDHIKEVDETELKKVYESMYGPKVKCRMIMWPHSEARRVQTEIYGKIRADEEEFARAARSQANPVLAGSGGEIAPIARHGFGNDPLLEQEAFSLKPGEVSRIINNKEGLIVLKCDAILPADSSRTFETEKATLRKEAIDRQLTREIPKFFASLRENAKPQIFLKRPNATWAETEEKVRQELLQTGGTRDVADPGSRR